MEVYTRPRMTFTGGQYKQKKDIHWRSIQDQEGHSLVVSTRPRRTFTGGEYKKKKDNHLRSVQDQEGHSLESMQDQNNIHWRSVPDQGGHSLEVNTSPRRAFSRS